MGQTVFPQCRCKGSSDIHLGAVEILKADTHAATIPALALVKPTFFSPFRCAAFVTKYLNKRDSNASKRTCILIHNYLKETTRKQKESVLIS